MRHRTSVNIAALTVGIGLVAASLVGCSSETEASVGASASAATTQASTAPSRQAYAGTRNVRICVSLNPSVTESIDLAAIQGSKGTNVTLDADNLGPECYVSDNRSYHGTAGVQALYEASTLIIYGQNLSLQRPDLLLCSRTTAPVVGPVDCAGGSQLDLKTFSEGDTKALTGNGHSVTAKRNKDTSDYIEFSVTIDG